MKRETLTETVEKNGAVLAIAIPVNVPLRDLGVVVFKVGTLRYPEETPYCYPPSAKIGGGAIAANVPHTYGEKIECIIALFWRLDKELETSLNDRQAGINLYCWKCFENQIGFVRAGALRRRLRLPESH